VGAVVVVAAVAAVMSYGHLRAVAAEQGESAAVLFPLSVDGLIVAASLVLLVRRRAGQPGGALAWAGLLVGVAATVAGNIASADPTALARIVAAWPPVAFALSYELLLALLRPAAEPEPAHAEPAPAEPATASPVPASPVPAPPVPAPPGPAIAARTAELDAAEPSPAAAPDPMPLTDADVADRVRQLAAADGRPPSRRALARDLRISEHRARVALDLAATNGENHR